jgi:PAS domain S-box-containing protein
LGENLLLLQTFVAAVAATGLLLGAALAERDRVADAVRESEERYRDLFENASNIIYGHDLHGNMTSFNRAGEQILGYSRDEMLQKNIVQILMPSSAELARSMTARKVAQGGRTTYELEVVARDGHLVCLEINSRLILRNGKPVGVQGVARDVTERKRADAALRESEERLRLALAAGHCGVWDWDIPSNRVTWSERTYEIHGVAAGTYGGTVEAFMALVHPEDAAKVSEAIRRAVEEGAPYSGEFRIVRPSGEARWVSTTGRVLYGGGKPMRMLGAILDTTERKLAEEALRDADRRKDEFLAMLAHELRNPLAPIRNALRILSVQGAAEREFETLRAVMERQVEHLVRMVDDLMDVSRIMRGRIELRAKPLKLTD